MQSEGLFFVRTWVLKLIPILESELSPSTADGNARDEEQRNYDQQLKLASFADDFVPFLAKNQFKKQIRKHAPVPKKDSI